MDAVHDLDDSLHATESSAKASSLAGLPSWITKELIAETQAAWTPVYGEPVTHDEAINIIQTFDRLTSMLGG